MATKYPNVESAIRWGKRVVSGKVPCCKYVKQAVERHFCEMAKSRSAKFKYRFDPAKAEKKLRLIQMLPHTKGSGHSSGNW